MNPSLSLVALDSADRQVVELKAERKQLKRLIREQQEKISALQNAGLIDVQRAKFALLKQEFAAVAAGQDQSAPGKARR